MIVSSSAQSRSSNVIDPENSETTLQWLIEWFYKIFDDRKKLHYWIFSIFDMIMMKVYILQY
jgi:hypothetical protein